MLIQNVHPDEYKYSGCSIRFYSSSELLFTDGNMRKNITIFIADMSLSVHIDNENKDILVIVEGLRQGLDDAKLTTETIYHIVLHNQRKDLY